MTTKIQEAEMSEEYTPFGEIFSQDVLDKIYKSYDEFMQIGDFSVNIVDYILKDVTANEHLNYYKILVNLEFTEESISEQPQFLLENCVAYHTIELELNNPDLLTDNHRMALYSLDLFYDMMGDEEYPHACFKDQLEEMANMCSEDEGMRRFTKSGYDMVKGEYISTYKEYIFTQAAKRKAV